MDRATTMVFIISDFVNLNKTNKVNFDLLSTLFETIAIIVKDPLDKSFPNINKEVVIEDPGTGEKLLINPKVAKDSYELFALEQTNEIKNIFRNAGVDFKEFDTSEHFALNLAEFLKERSKRRVFKKKDVH